MQIAITNRDNKIQPQIIKHLKEAQKSIWIAVAWFTDKEIYQVLCEKLKQGVKVRLIALYDDINQERGVDFDSLSKQGAEVYLTQDENLLMHHKFCIIDSQVVIMGSYNYTYKAQDQRESVIISKYEQQIINEFEAEFEDMLKENFGVSPKQNQKQILTPARFPFEPEMVFVEGGTFQMGSNNRECWNEKPIHSVTVSSFNIGKYQLTQKLWVAMMGSNPSYFKGDDLPVECVSWNDTQEYIKKLNEKTGKKYRLPTEAEWEFAARGGNKSKGYQYAGSDTPNDIAWFSENSDSKTHPVGTKKPNELGIYDMSGNIGEWCEDRYDAEFYEKSAGAKNPVNKNTGSYHERVNRGGGWYYNAVSLRVARRSGNTLANSNRNLGFRLVCL